MFAWPAPAFPFLLAFPRITTCQASLVGHPSADGWALENEPSARPSVKEDHEWRRNYLDGARLRRWIGDDNAAYRSAFSGFLPAALLPEGQFPVRSMAQELLGTTDRI